ncbi:PREDICTED: uncharacterized protein LOC104588469 [Nelumbo nucifera]|uniref:Uncharacterized protein LOC104588469 n=1 Tax=Nelumbo nucifera TaxID=4432 RepID=A0A1U7ZAD9_NELNU|nr:PREDICTED: uncharacterized protein LOC104588469 [Nelumbo nucifera]
MVQGSTSDPENIKGVHAITTRSGKVLDGPLPSPPCTNVTTLSRTEDAPSKEPEKEVIIQVPFPQALRSRGKILDNQGEILEHLKEFKINIPLLHVIKQVSFYAKVIKDLCTIKRRHHVNKTAFLTEQLGLGEIKPTPVVLQLADRSIRKPRGIVEDILLQIDKFYYPIDFLVLDTQSLSFENMILEVNIFHVGKQPHDEDECYHTYMIDSFITEEVDERENFESLEYLLCDSDLNSEFLFYPVNDVFNVSSIPNDMQDKKKML